PYTGFPLCLPNRQAVLWHWPPATPFRNCASGPAARPSGSCCSALPAARRGPRRGYGKYIKIQDILPPFGFDILEQAFQGAVLPFVPAVVKQHRDDQRGLFPVADLLQQARENITADLKGRMFIHVAFVLDEQ